MDEENKAEVKPEGEKPAEGESTQVAPAPNEQLTKLEAELASAKQAVDDARKEALAHQRTASKKAEEVERLRKLEEARDQKLDLLIQYLGEKETETEEGEEKPKRKSQDFIAKFKEIDQRQKSSVVEVERQRIAALATEAEKLIRPLGLTMNQSPELREAYLRFLEGDPETGLEETKKAVKAMTEAKKETKPQKSEADLRKEIEEEVRKKIYEEKGWNISDTGHPSPGGQKITAKSVKGMSPQEIVANSKEISKLPLSI